MSWLTRGATGAAGLFAVSLRVCGNRAGRFAAVHESGVGRTSDRAVQYHRSDLGQTRHVADIANLVLLTDAVEKVADPADFPFSKGPNEPINR